VLRSAPAKVSVYQGDGRISMDRWSGGTFDVILVDAFAGGHVPPHLLTHEALEVYGRRLSPGGLLVLHVSHHLPLQDQVGATLDGSAWNGVLLLSGAVVGRDKAGQELFIEYPSLAWVLARDAAEIQDPAFEANAAELAVQDAAAVKPGREPLYRLWKARSKGLRPWTDDLQSLAPLLYQWAVR
jgi:spermidine synthase